MIDPPSVATLKATAASTGPVQTLAADDLVTTDGNRWSGAGEPTIYVASDAGVALAEYGRHWEARAEPVAIWLLDISLTAVADLRKPDVREQLDLPSEMTWILERRVALGVAERIRRMGAEAIIVPSAAFLDDLERWNAVLFLECLRRPLQDVLTVVRRAMVITP